MVADKLNFFRYISHFRCIHRGAFFAQMRTTAVRKLLPEAWGRSLHPTPTPFCIYYIHLTPSVYIISTVHPTVYIIYPISPSVYITYTPPLLFILYPPYTLLFILYIPHTFLFILYTLYPLLFILYTPYPLLYILYTPYPHLFILHIGNTPPKISLLDNFELNNFLLYSLHDSLGPFLRRFPLPSPHTRWRPVWLDESSQRQLPGDTAHVLFYLYVR